jgi:putative nucleotidyltransferase with HDIG domain
MAQPENDKLIAFVEKMPAFPKSVQRVLQLTSDLNAPAKEIVRVIECDPIMTIKILKAINSSFYGLPKKISSIQRAVVHLGLNTIKNLALGVAAMGMLNNKNRAGFNTDDFLLHSLTTAAVSRMLAARLGLPLSECSDCFVAGLLHDFGKVVLAEFMPAEFRAVLEKSKQRNMPLNLAELEFIGFDHAQAGKILAEKWELSALLVDAIANHHDTGDSDNPMRDCLFAANQISKHMQSGDGGNAVIEPFPDFIDTRFGMPFTALIDALGDLELIRTEARSLIAL